MIEKTYKGKTLKVEVLEVGFRFERKEWRSLTAIAMAVTGAKSINGPLFFGIAKRASKATGRGALTDGLRRHPRRPARAGPLLRRQRPRVLRPPRLRRQHGARDGHTIAGQPVVRMTVADARAWHRELGRWPRCEGCGREFQILTGRDAR